MPLFSDPVVFRKHAMTTRRPGAHLQADFVNLQLILTSICLRRSDIAVPEQGLTTEIRRPCLSSAERKHYDNLMRNCRNLLRLSSKSAVKNGIERMTLLLELRMACNNGAHGIARGGRSKIIYSDDQWLSLLQQSNEDLCAFCADKVDSVGPLDDTATGFLTQCKRAICAACVPTYKQASETGHRPQCAICSEEHLMESAASAASSVAEEFMMPTKIGLVVKDIEQHCNEKW